MADDPELFYFIDDNRAYRGPINKATLHLLFVTEAITPSTYVFAEHLSSDHSWVRLKRQPELMAMLSKPLPSPRSSSSERLQAAPGPAASALSAAEQPSEEQPNGSSVPRQHTNPTTEGGATTSRADSAATSSAHGGATIDVNDAASPVITQPAAVCATPQSGAFLLNQAQPQERLYHEHFANARLSSSVAAAPRRGFFGTRKPPKSAFGKPLSSCELDATRGVPSVLCELRKMLFSHNGHLVEGIFRVSPSQTVLKEAQKHAESNHYAKVATSGPESIATLIKLWFRTCTLTATRSAYRPIARFRHLPTATSSPPRRAPSRSPCTTHDAPSALLLPSSRRRSARVDLRSVPRAHHRRSTRGW